MDLAGVVLDGRYRVIEPIAQGAMGVVYRAERLKLGRIVAIKVLHDDLPDDLSSRQRFEIEAMAMAKLEHPHCASVVDVGIHEARPYVVMDFVSGDNLRSLTTHGAVPQARAVEIMRQVLSGLAHAHELGIVHRDIKPANIVLSQKAGLGDHVKILDFGLAKFAQSGSRLTQGIAVGTPAYMAPEQCNGGAIDARTDLYACSILLYELLTGGKPFHSRTDDPVEVVRMHLFTKPPRLDASFGELAEIVEKGLAKDPDERFQTAEEFAAALRMTMGSQPVIAVPRMTSQPVIEVPRADSQASLPQAQRESQPVIEAPRAATQPSQPVVHAAPASKPPTRRQLAIGGGGLLVVIIIIAAVASGGGHEAAPGDAAIAVAKPEPPPQPPPAVDDTLARAEALIAAGRTEEALKVLAGGRLVFPQNAQLPLAAGKLYFAKLWFGDGIAAFRAAVKIDPALAHDPELMKIALRGFITTPRYEPELADFLHDVVGPAAKPMLEETAKGHPNATVRARATSELRRY